MIKHTPGPWEIGEEHESKVDIISKDGKTIATATPAGGLWCDKEMKENAKLIAAAPEMYELLDQLTGEDIWWDEWNAPINIGQDIRNLIEKINSKK